MARNYFIGGVHASFYAALFVAYAVILGGGIFGLWALCEGLLWLFSR